MTARAEPAASAPRSLVRAVLAMRFLTQGMAVSTTIGAVVVGLALSLLIVVLQGHSATDAMVAVWDGAWGNERVTATTISRAIPLALCGLAWIVASSTARLNIGVEGQILIGGAFATAVGVHFAGLPIGVHLPLAVLAGAIGGAFWAGIAAMLWLRRGVSEIFSTLLLNLVAVQIIAWLVREGPLSDGGRAFARSHEITPTARWPRLFDNYVLSWDFVIAIVAVLIIGVLLPRTALGLKLRFVGANPEAARFGGVSVGLLSGGALAASGALGGLAGSSVILASETYRMHDYFSANYGFLGIVVALVARNQPLFVVPSAMFFAFLLQGSALLQARVGVPDALVTITTGLVIITTAASSFLVDQLRNRRVDTEPPAGSIATADPASVLAEPSEAQLGMEERAP